MTSPSAFFELIVVGGPNDGTSLPVSGPVTFGTGEYNSVRLDQPGVAPSHAKLDLIEDGTLWVTDLSGGATLVDDAVVSQVSLPNGARLKIGSAEFKVLQRQNSIRVRAPNVRVSWAPASSPAPVPILLSVPLSSHKTMLAPSHPAPALRNEKPDDATLRPGEAQALMRIEREREAKPKPKQRVRDVEPNVLSDDQTIMRSVMLPQQVIGGRYRILDKLATGGMGEVYKAEHVELGKIFALKVMKLELSEDPEFVSRFKREAVASSRIGQHNIIDISDFGRTDDGRFYFVMEYLDGQTLADLITADPSQPLEKAVRIGLQIARALSAAHQQGIVHRDLKPENIVLVTRDGQNDFVKVLDFGVAKELDGRGVKSGNTAIGMVVGTPAYMSPEQASAVPVDARSDIYALGLIIHEILSGRPVFSGESPSLLMVAQVTQAPRRLTSGLGVSIPPALEALVMAMLVKRPEGRPQTMHEVVRTLEDIAELPSVRRSTAKTIPARATPSRGPASSRAAAGPTDLLPSRPNLRLEARAEAPEPHKPPSETFSDFELHKSHTPLIAVLVVLALAALVTVGMLLKADAPPEALKEVVAAPEAEQPAVAVKPPGPVLPAAFSVSISTHPSRVDVYEDDGQLGRTPFTLPIKRGGSRTVTFKHAGFLSETRTFKPATDLEVDVKLRPVPPAAPPQIFKKPPRKPVSDDLKDAPY